ncbi:hypothetical protein B7Y92_00350 [Candidatus Saccharibacteria bacterium 32-50-13]|nr:MAG: hypothetical protein B7Y92_00350 [Candidatus Saccharibacteria bacterium 32-50-13]
MTSIINKIFRRPARRSTYVKKGRFAYINAMTSTELEEFVQSEDITPEEFAYVIKLQKRLARA